MPKTQTSIPPPPAGARGAALTPAYVYDFSEGHKDLKNLLGGKGANLAEMTRIGLPVPPGFTVTTEACRAYLAAGDEPPELRAEVRDHLARLERTMGRRLGRGTDPLLVSVRSGARFSMPGMMDTVLNIGLSDASVVALAAQTSDERFAWDSYRRLIQMFGGTVLGIDGGLFEERIAARKRTVGATTDTALTADDLRVLVDEFKGIVRTATGRDFPQDPHEQLRLAIRAVFDSWNGDRARLYRRQHHIPHDLGTAVNVCAMVFGNLGADSGTGVAFTRDPATGHRGVYGDYLANAQGEDVVAGIRNTVPLSELEHLDPASYHQLLGIMDTLEAHYQDLCDIEFTIERGTLWMLQTRVGQRTAAAAFRIATALVDEGIIDEDEALRRVNGEQLARLMFPHFDPAAEVEPVATGIPASPGAAVGTVVFDPATAVDRAAAGERVVLVRRETTPDDLNGMIAAAGILTSRGGKTSHAAVVARGMGTTCVCGAEELEVDPVARRATVTSSGTVLREGDTVSLDGATGRIYAGAVPVVPSPVVEYFEGRVRPDDPGADDLVRAVDRVMAWADQRRRLAVRANADTAADATRARRFGAQGIGLCRTEHMFLGDRRTLVEQLVLADGAAERDRALEALRPLQEADFRELFAAMDGLPVTVRLLDPPLHEFLPDLTELSVRVALADRDAPNAGPANDGSSHGGSPHGGSPHGGATHGAAPAGAPGGHGDDRNQSSGHDRRLLEAVRRLHEQNPMLGLRGVRLGLVIPGLFAMQVRAVAQAAADRIEAAGKPRVEIMIPLVGTVEELDIVRAESERVIAEVAATRGVTLDLALGTMIELPRAALTADQIARSADFFSFGTNDLTQTVWGFSRDDVEASFFHAYLDRGIFGASPFETIDVDGVGALVRTAVRAGRRARPELKLGVCGEHGGDPDSVRFFHEVGLDYVSCSPFRVPVARLEAGRAAAEPTTG